MWQGPTNDTLSFYECRLSGGDTQEVVGTNSLKLFYTQEAVGIKNIFLVPAHTLLYLEPPGETFTA